MGRYAYSRIHSPKAKAAYINAMRECVKHVSSGLDNMDMIYARIESVRSHTNEYYPTKIFSNREDERSNHILAVEHAMEIVKSLEARFLTGTSDSEPRGFKDRGIAYHYDPTLFEE